MVSLFCKELFMKPGGKWDYHEGDEYKAIKD